MRDGLFGHQHRIINKDPLVKEIKSFSGDERQSCEHHRWPNSPESASHEVVPVDLALILITLLQQNVGDQEPGKREENVYSEVSSFEKSYDGVPCGGTFSKIWLPKNHVMEKEDPEHGKSPETVQGMQR